jgi:cytochrome c oxidase cbb3-type subunit 1
MWGGNLAWFVFWGYQLFIVMAATGYLLGSTQGQEYAEPEWLTDLWLTIVWVAFLAVLHGHAPEAERAAHLRRELVPSELHRHRGDAAPRQQPADPRVDLRLLLGAGDVGRAERDDAVVVRPQRRGLLPDGGLPGHDVLLHPKQAERPVYSYKLSIIHFWALIFLYIWAGPHHLHYTALPDWASTLGMVFSVVLWMPSWGGMINGLMTLSGAWDKLRTDPVLRMMVTSVAFYGMSTFEGPMMSIRAVNSLSHYTDWTIGHVHSGALGWNGMITFGMLYYLFPKLWNRQSLYSLKAVSWHYWLATIGIVLYAASMWVTGIMEGLMWREVDAQGFLVNSFADTVAAKFPMYVVRGSRWVMFLTGALIMVWNLWMTVTKGEARKDAPVAAPAE